MTVSQQLMACTASYQAFKKKMKIIRRGSNEQLDKHARDCAQSRILIRDTGAGVMFRRGIWEGVDYMS